MSAQLLKYNKKMMIFSMVMVLIIASNMMHLNGWKPSRKIRFSAKDIFESGGMILNRIHFIFHDI